MNLAERMAEDRRGVILALLLADDGWRLGDEALRVALSRLGRGTLRVSVVQADLAWLEQHRLVRIERDHGTDGTPVWVAVLTREGRAVAEGAAHPGVTRPDPA